MVTLRKTGLLLGALMVLGMGAKAQDEVEATVAADIVSQYVWRGQDLGHASLQPTLGLSYKGLSLTGWGSIGISEPKDTKDLEYGSYRYDVELITKAGDVFTVIAPTSFKLTSEVTVDE